MNRHLRASRCHRQQPSEADRPAGHEGAHLTANRSWTFQLPRERALTLDHKPLVMAILNVTPDSFSDGGRWLDPERAIERGLQMAREGADLIDLGAESTRPGGGVYGQGAEEISVSEELDRLLPALEGLRREVDLPLSADTRKGGVARAAIASGADLINDVGGLTDPELVAVVAQTGCPVIVMHSRGELATMQSAIHFDDVCGEVRDELSQRCRDALSRGVQDHQIILDPGIGFGKTALDNLRLLRELDRLSELGRPLLIGASRKSFIARVHEAPPVERLGGSLAAAGWATRAGASILRVHDVAATRQFLDVWNAIDSAPAKRA